MWGKTVTPAFQFLAGLSMLVISVGITWSLIGGAVLKFQIAGANLSVNEKLEQVEKIKNDLEETKDQVKQEPSASPIRIKAIEKELEQVTNEINQTQEEVIDDLEGKDDQVPL